jgi:glycine hydroxymethyltransferase
MLVNVRDTFHVTGLQAQLLLESVNITCNKNSIPGDKEKPAYTSGIRLGTPAMTTRGFKEQEFRMVGKWIASVLKNPEDTALHAKVKEEVLALTAKHPLPYEKD